MSGEGAGWLSIRLPRLVLVVMMVMLAQMVLLGVDAEGITCRALTAEGGAETNLAVAVTVAVAPAAPVVAAARAGTMGTTAETRQGGKHRQRDHSVFRLSGLISPGTGGRWRNWPRS